MTRTSGPPLCNTRSLVAPLLPQVAMNLDPELPTPNRAQLADQHQFGYFYKWKDRGRTDPHGISWDSLTSWTLVRWRCDFLGTTLRCIVAKADASPCSGA